MNNGTTTMNNNNNQQHGQMGNGTNSARMLKNNVVNAMVTTNNNAEMVTNVKVKTWKSKQMQQQTEQQSEHQQYRQQYQQCQNTSECININNNWEQCNNDHNNNIGQMVNQCNSQQCITINVRIPHRITTTK